MLFTLLIVISTFTPGDYPMTASKKTDRNVL